MPFEPNMLTTEADEVPLRSANEPRPHEPDYVPPAEREPASPPEPPAAVAEPVEEPEEPEAEVEVADFGSPADMLQALQEAGVDFEGEPGAEGWTAEEAQQAQDFLDELDELAEDDPLAAADLLAHAYRQQLAAQVRAEAAEQLAPMVAREHRAAAADVLTQLEAEFGYETLEANRERLAAAIAGNESSFMYGGVDARGIPIALDAAGRHQRLREALITAEHDRQAAYARGDDLKAAIREAVPPIERDAFGVRPPGEPDPYPVEGQPVAPPPSQAAPRASAQPRTPDGRYASPAVQGPVHVEGGSGGQPSWSSTRPLSPDEQTKAAIRAAGHGGERDLFGRLRPPGGVAQ